MDIEKKNTVSVKEIEENVKEEEQSSVKEEGPKFPALPAQDLVVCC